MYIGKYIGDNTIKCQDSSVNIDIIIKFVVKPTYHQRTHFPFIII